MDYELFVKFENATGRLLERLSGPDAAVVLESARALAARSIVEGLVCIPLALVSLLLFSRVLLFFRSEDCSDDTAEVLSVIGMAVFSVLTVIFGVVSFQVLDPLSWIALWHPEVWLFNVLLKG